MNPAILAFAVTSTAPIHMTGTEAALYRLGVEWQARAESKAAEARANKKIADRRGEDLARCEEARASAAVEAPTPTWSAPQVVLVAAGVVAVFVGGVALGTQIK